MAWLVQASKVSRKAIFKKAEAYVKEYKNMEKSLITSRRQGEHPHLCLS